MKLVHKYIEKEIVFDENIVNILVIENKEYFTKLCMEFLSQADGNEGDFILSENNKPLNFSKSVMVISDPLNLDINSKKLISALYTRLESMVSENLFAETAEIKSLLMEYLSKVDLNFDYNIDYNDDIKLSDIFKICNVGFVPCEKFDERLVEFLKIAEEFLKCRVFVFINLKNFLSNSQLKELYKFVFYNKINLLLVENMRDDVIEGETALIVDEDLCEIY